MDIINIIEFSLYPFCKTKINKNEQLTSQHKHGVCGKKRFPFLADMFMNILTLIYTLNFKFIVKVPIIHQ